MPRSELNLGCKRPVFEYCETLGKETEENANGWRCVLCSGMGGIDIMEMSVLPKAICEFGAILIEIPVEYFVELEQIFQKFI